MIDKLSHYSLTANPTIHDEEAFTSLELAGRTAKKVNEVIELVNENETNVRQAKEYMTDNLPNFVDEKINEMGESGVLANKLVDAVCAGKVDKDGVGQIKMSMLAQEVKQAMTGGSVAVTGANSVSSENIVDNSVTLEKLKKHLIPYHYTSTKKPTPAEAWFDINTTTGEVTKLLTSQIVFDSPQSVLNVKMSEVEIAVHADLTSVSHVNLWYDDVTKVLHFYRLENANKEIFREFIYLGLINLNYPLATNCIMPFTINGEFYFSPNRDNRRSFAYLEVDYHANCKNGCAYVDWSRNVLVFAPFDNMYVVHENGYETLYQDMQLGYEIAIPDTCTIYGYVVAGAGGISILSPSEFMDSMGSFSKNQMWFLGYINVLNKKLHLLTKTGEGKTISFLGDSITTYKEYIPEGNECYYTGSNCGVNSEHQTWWMRVCNAKGYVLNTNNSWSGSKVSNKSSLVSNAMVRCTELDNGVDPDIIIMLMGINDFNSGVALGTYNGRGTIPITGNTFREAYAITLNKMLTRYKTSKVYVCTLPVVDRTVADTTSPESNSAGVYLTEYNDAIREIAKAFCVEVIDLESCGITHQNASLYMGDFKEVGSFTHPNSEGHRLMSEKVLRTI